jgi:hypothetical protein
MDALERRQGEAESIARQTHQDLSQAIEARPKKAVIPKSRQITRDPGKGQSPEPATPGSRARGFATGGQEASARGGKVRPGGRELRPGMTQDEVRRLLGEPISIEPMGAYVFWHYSPMSTQQYVIFEHLSGRVVSWRGPFL